MRSPVRSCAVFLALATGAAAAAEAEVAVEAPSAPSPASNPNDLGFDATILGTVQRFGGLLDLRAHFRHRLYESTDEAFSDNYLGVSLVNQVAPILIHSGAQVDFAPTSFLRVSGGYQFVGYFGTLGTLRTATGCHGAGALSATDLTCNYRPDTGDAAGLGGLGHRAFVELALQAKLGRFLFFGGARLERWWMQPLGDSSHADYWVNELYGLPQAMADTVFTGGGAVLFEAITEAPGRPQLLIGAVDDVMYASTADVLLHRVGPAAILRIPKWKGLRELTLTGAVQFYTHERYLAGQVPFIVLALSGSTANLLGTP